MNNELLEFIKDLLRLKGLTNELILDHVAKSYVNRIKECL